MNLSKKQKQTHRHRMDLWLPKERKDERRDGVRVWDWQVQTIIYRMHKQRGGRGGKRDVNNFEYYIFMV